MPPLRRRSEKAVRDAGTLKGTLKKVITEVVRMRKDGVCEYSDEWLASFCRTHSTLKKHGEFHTGTSLRPAILGSLSANRRSKERTSSGIVMLFREGVSALEPDYLKSLGFSESMIAQLMKDGSDVDRMPNDGVLDACDAEPTEKATLSPEMLTFATGEEVIAAFRKLYEMISVWTLNLSQAVADTASTSKAAAVKMPRAPPGGIGAFCDMALSIPRNKGQILQPVPVPKVLPLLRSLTCCTLRDFAHGRHPDPEPFPLAILILRKIRTMKTSVEVIHFLSSVLGGKELAASMSHEDTLRIANELDEEIYRSASFQRSHLVSPACQFTIELTRRLQNLLCDTELARSSDGFWNQHSDLYDGMAAISNDMYFAVYTAAHASPRVELFWPEEGQSFDGTRMESFSQQTADESTPVTMVEFPGLQVPVENSAKILMKAKVWTGQESS